MNASAPVLGSGSGSTSSTGRHVYRPRIELEAHPGVYVIRLLGEHDLSTALELSRSIEEALVTADVVVDLDDASFIDSAVAHTLIRIRHTAHAAGRSFRVKLRAEHPLRSVLWFADTAITPAERPLSSRAEHGVDT